MSRGAEFVGAGRGGMVHAVSGGKVLLVDAQLGPCFPSHVDTPF